MAPNPVSITIPPKLRIVITAQTNALYCQLIFLTDTGDGIDYLLHGLGENSAPMKMDDFSDGHVHVPDGRLQLDAIGTPRTLIFRCKYQKPGADETLYDSAVRLQADDDGPDEIVKRWVINTEDGVDNDFNDEIIEVIAAPEEGE